MAAEQWSKFIGLLGDQTRDHDTTALADDALIFAGLHLNADPPHQAPWDTSHVKNAFDALSASLQFLSSASTSVFASTNILEMLEAANKRYDVLQDLEPYSTRSPSSLVAVIAENIDSTDLLHRTGWSFEVSSEKDLTSLDEPGLFALAESISWPSNDLLHENMVPCSCKCSTFLNATEPEDPSKKIASSEEIPNGLEDCHDIYEHHQSNTIQYYWQDHVFESTSKLANQQGTPYASQIDVPQLLQNGFMEAVPRLILQNANELQELEHSAVGENSLHTELKTMADLSDDGAHFLGGAAEIQNTYEHSMRPLNVQSLLCESSTVFGDSRIFELDHPSLSDESDGHWKFAAAGGLLELMPWPRINVEKNGIERILDIAAQAEPLQDADENVCFDTSAHVPRLTAPMLECKQKAVPIPSIQLLRSMEPLETRSTVGLELRLDWTILTKGKISYVHSVDMVEPTLQYNDVSKLVMSPAQPISFIRWLSSDTMLQETLHMYDHARGEDEEFLPTYALGNRAACFCPPAWQEPKFCDLPSDHIDLLQRLRSDHDRCLGLPEALSLPMEYGTFPPDLQRLKALESETRCVNERQSAASVLAETLLTLGTCGRMVFNYDRVAGLVFLQHKLRSCPKIEAYIRHVRPIIQQTVHQKALPTHPKLATTLVDQFVRLSLQKHVRVILVMDIQAAFLALRQIAAYTRFMPLLFDPDSSRLWSLGLNSRSPNDAARSINSIFESDVNVCIVPAYVLERALIATDENLLGTHIVSLHSVNDEPGLKASIDNRANGYIIYQLLTREIDLTQSTSTGVAATPATEARRYNDACIHSLEYDVPNKRHKKASDEEVQLPAQRDSQESGNDDRHSDPGVSGTVISDARFASTSQRDLRFCYTHNQGSEAEHGTSNVQPQAAPLAIPKRCNRTFNDHGSSVLDGQTCHPHDGHENTSSNRQMIVGVINTARPLVNQQNIATRLQHLQNEQHRCTFSKRTLEHGADLVLWTDSGIIGLVLLAADASESQTWDDVLQDTASSLAAACSIYAAVFVICSLSGAGVAGAEVAFGKFDGILRASVLDATIVVMTVREVEAVANAVSGIVQNVKPGWGSTALIELLRNEESIEYEALLESKYALDPFTCSALARSGLKIENVSAGRHPMSLEEIQETVVEISRFCIPPKAVYRLDAVLKDLHSKSRFDGFNEDQRQSSTSSYFPELVNGDEDDNAAHRAEDGINTIAAQKAEKERYEWLKHSYVPDENLHPPYEDATTELREDQLCSISEEEEKARRLRTQDANQKHVHNGGSIRDMAEQFFSKRQRGQAELKKAQMDVSNPKHVHNLRKGLPSQNCRETAAHDLTQPRLQSSHDDSMHETWAQLGLAPPPDEADESIWNASSSRSMESQYSEAKPYSKRREAQKQLTSSVYLEQFRYNNDVSAPQKKQQQQQKGMKDIRTWLRQGSDSCSSETELKSSYLPSRSRGHAEGRLTASKRKTSEGSTGSCQTKHRRGSSDSGQSSSSGTRRSGAPLSESVLQRMRQRIGTT